jgi:predicted transcriptional regulator
MAKLKAKSREGMIISTIALPPELHRRLALAALDRNAAITALVREALEEYLDRHEKSAKRGSR